MMQCPRLKPPTLARLALFVACIGVVATSQPTSPSVSTEHQGPPVSLTNSEPKVTRHLVARVALEKGVLDNAEVDLTAQITARWRPADPRNSIKPWLRVQLNMGRNAGLATPAVLGESDQPTVVTTHVASYFECSHKQECTWDVSLEIELQANAVEGVAEVDWKVLAEARAVGTNEVPPGFTVQLLE